METEKNTVSRTPEAIARLKAETALNKLGDYNNQIWSVGNILRLLYEILEVEEKEIATKASVMIVCIWQLEYIYNQLSDLLENIMDCGLVRPSIQL